MVLGSIKNIEKCPFLRGSVLLPRPLFLSPFQSFKTVSNSGLTGFSNRLKNVKGFQIIGFMKI
jgi:hypothetical protein